MRTFKFINNFYKQPFQVRLVSILEDYKLSRQQKEEEKKRYRVNSSYAALNVFFSS